MSLHLVIRCAISSQSGARALYITVIIRCRTYFYAFYWYIYILCDMYVRIICLIQCFLVIPVNEMRIASEDLPRYFHRIISLSALYITKPYFPPL